MSLANEGVRRGTTGALERPPVDGDHDARVEFEIRTRNDYADHLPFLLAYRRAVLRRA